MAELSAGEGDVGTGCRRPALLAVAFATLLPGTIACAEDSHLRLPPDPAIHTAIDLALQRSPTFRQLVRVIEQSDSLVYVVAGDCEYGRRACLMRVTATARYRIMLVLVDARLVHPDPDVAGAIGHELQHVAEVISYPSVRSTEEMVALYRRIGFHATAGGFETTAAVTAGEAVRREVRRR